MTFASSVVGQPSCILANAHDLPGRNWQDADPLSIPRSQIRIWNLLESSLCASNSHSVDCTCDALKMLYGSRIFRCSRPGCPSFRAGFETKDQRNQHARVHQRPFKCEHNDCDFSDLGFGKQSDLNAHLSRYHRKCSNGKEISDKGAVGEAEREMIFQDAIRSHNSELAEDILSVWERKNYKLKLSIMEALDSMPPASLLFRLIDSTAIDHWKTKAILNHMAESYDEETTIACTKYQEWETENRHYKRAATRGSFEMVKAFKSGKQRFGSHFRRAMIPKRPDPQLETFAAESFQRFDTAGNKVEYLRELRIVASTCCSIPLARFFIRRGADIHEKNRQHMTRPLLFLAMTKDRMESIEFARFLIRCGVDPTVAYKGKRLQDTPAGTSIRKWTALSWDEFVEDAKNSTG